MHIFLPVVNTNCDVRLGDLFKYQLKRGFFRFINQVKKKYFCDGTDKRFFYDDIDKRFFFQKLYLFY